MTLNLTNVYFINISDRFMYLNISFALFTLILTRIILYLIKFKLKLIREDKLLFKKNVNCSVNDEIILLLTNLIINN